MRRPFMCFLEMSHFQLNDSKKAFEAYEKSLDFGVTDFLIWNRYLILGIELQEYDRVYKNGVKAVELTPYTTNALFVYWVCRIL